MAEATEDTARSGDGRTVGLGAATGGPGLGALTAWAGQAAWRRALILILIGLALLGPGVAIFAAVAPLETERAAIVERMLTSGDLVAPDDLTFPIGGLWAQAGAVSALDAGALAWLGDPLGLEARDQIWPHRLPSLLGALLATLIAGWAMRPLIGARAGFLAAAMLAGLLLVAVAARLAVVDALLLASVLAAQGALARLWFGVKDGARERGTNIAIFWTALAIGALLDGPVVFAPALGVILWMCLYDRSLAGLGRLGLGWGVVWLLLLLAPWHAAMAAKTGGAFFDGYLSGLLGHGPRARGVEAPPGAHALLFWASFWPWTLLALVAAPRAWRWRRAPETAFLFGWIAPAWILFELAELKAPWDVLPVFPALLALAAAAAVDGAARPRGPLFAIGLALWALPALALPIGAALAPHLDLAALPELRLTGVWLWQPIALAAAALAAFVTAVGWLRSGVWIGFIRATLTGAAAAYAALFLYAPPDAADRLGAALAASLQGGVREAPSPDASPPAKPAPAKPAPAKSAPDEPAPDEPAPNEAPPQ